MKNIYSLFQQKILTKVTSCSEQLLTLQKPFQFWEKKSRVLIPGKVTKISWNLNELVKRSKIKYTLRPCCFSTNVSQGYENTHDQRRTLLFERKLFKIPKKKCRSNIELDFSKCSHLTFVKLTDYWIISGNSDSCFHWSQL